VRATVSVRTNLCGWCSVRGPIALGTELYNGPTQAVLSDSMHAGKQIPHSIYPWQSTLLTNSAVRVASARFNPGVEPIEEAPLRLQSLSYSWVE